MQLNRELINLPNSPSTKYIVSTSLSSRNLVQSFEVRRALRFRVTYSCALLDNISKYNRFFYSTLPPTLRTDGPRRGIWPRWRLESNGFLLHYWRWVAEWLATTTIAKMLKSWWGWSLIEHKGFNIRTYLRHGLAMVLKFFDRYGLHIFSCSLSYFERKINAFNKHTTAIFRSRHASMFARCYVNRSKMRTSRSSKISLDVINRWNVRIETAFHYAC